MIVMMDFHGRSVRFTEERRRHIAEFGDRGESARAIGKTLLKPDVMTEAFHHPKLRLFYRIYSRRMPDKRNFHVVVKVRGYDMLVVTAFFGRGLKWGEPTWEA